MPVNDQQLSVPKYRKIAEELKAQILAGQLGPGARLPSFMEMRTRFAATQSTIDKCIALLENEKLVARKPGSGIYVQEKDSGPATTGGTIGLVLPHLHFATQSPYWLELLQSIRDACESSESQILLLDPKNLAGWEKADGVLLCEWNVGGVWSQLPNDMPRVSLLSPTPDQAAVVADDYQGGRLATEHLLGLGHRRIAYLRTWSQLVVDRRRDGYRDALLKAGVDPLVSWERTLTGRTWLDASFYDCGYAEMTRWLDQGWDNLNCTALLAHNDEVALGAIKALEEHGLNVPGDVSVIGFDGVMARPGLDLTTVRVPLRGVGETAVAMLLEQIHGELFHRHITLPVTLHTGATTGVPR